MAINWVRGAAGRALLCALAGAEVGCGALARDAARDSCRGGGSCSINEDVAWALGFTATTLVAAGITGLVYAFRRRPGSPSGAEAPREDCSLPATSVVVCRSLHDYRFAIPAPGPCPVGSQQLGAIPLTCDALDRPAWHACMDGRGGWRAIRAWEHCSAFRMTDAAGDFVPPGRQPDQGVAPDGIAPPSRLGPPRGGGGNVVAEVPTREVVRQVLLQVQERAAGCLPPGVTALRFTYQGDGSVRAVDPAAEGVSPETASCVAEHARAVPLPTFTRPEFTVVFPMSRATPGGAAP